MINLTNAEYHFSYYENLYSSKAPEGELDINELIEIVKYGYLKEPIAKLRAAQNKKSYDIIKQRDLPAVTLSGIFTERNSKALKEHSGLIQVDIDQLENYKEVFQKLIADEYTYVAFKSPGGKGIKVIVKVNPDEATHLEQFYALEQHYLNNYAIEIDKSCKDLARCMLLSYDPNIYCNPFSDVFAECYMPNKLEEAGAKYHTFSLNLSTTEQDVLIEQLLANIEKNKLDLSYSYENWIKIGYAISGAFGEGGREYFHRISKFHPEYNPKECDKQYTQLNRRNTGSISLGTLVYLAKQNNIELSYSSDVQANTEAISAPKPVLKEFNPDGLSLYDLLRRRRAKLAKSNNVPAYLIFKDATLEEMVKLLPETQEEFAKLKGVGLKKVEQYAMYFLPLIRKYKGLEGIVKLKFGEEFQQQKSTSYSFNEKEKDLYNRLRDIRLRISKEEGVKPYWIFGNSTLTEIVQFKPRNKNQLLGLKGIAEKKVDWFGQEIIDEIEKLFG